MKPLNGCSSISSYICHSLLLQVFKICILFTEYRVFFHACVYDLGLELCFLLRFIFTYHVAVVVKCLFCDVDVLD